MRGANNSLGTPTDYRDKKGNVAQFLSCRFICAHIGVEKILQTAQAQGETCGACLHGACMCAEMRAKRFCICVMFRDIQVTEDTRWAGLTGGETYWKEMDAAMIMMLLLS